MLLGSPEPPPGALCVPAARRFSRRWRPPESAGEPSRTRLPPALQELAAGAWRWHRRCSHRERDLAAYHGAEHVSISTYEHGERAAKKHERCGSTSSGRCCWPRPGARPLPGKAPVGPRGGRSRRRLGRWPPRPRSSTGWCATPEHPVARALPGPARSSRSASLRRAVAGAGGGRQTLPSAPACSSSQLGGSGGTVLVAEATQAYQRHCHCSPPSLDPLGFTPSADALIVGAILDDVGGMLLILAPAGAYVSDGVLPLAVVKLTPRVLSRVPVELGRLLERRRGPDRGQDRARRSSISSVTRSGSSNSVRACPRASSSTGLPGTGRRCWPRPWHTSPARRSSPRARPRSSRCSRPRRGPYPEALRRGAAG